jgi:hypothetical protein
MVFVGELELRDALLKFRGPGIGDSEKVGGEMMLNKEDLGGSILSVSSEKDRAGPGKELKKRPLS